MVAKVQTKAGAAVQAWVMMYEAVVQTVLMYWSEIQVVTGAMLIVIEGFNHRVDRQIMRKTANRAGDSGRE